VADIAQHPAAAPAFGWNKVVGAFHLMQPTETVFLQALPACLFMRVAAPDGDIRRVLLLGLSVIAIYGSVGSLNDYCDYSLDKMAKPAKPLVRGLVSRSYAMKQAWVLGPIGLLLSLALSWQTACFAAIVLIFGVWYDVWAKRSLFSWVPYAVGIPSLPMWGFAAAGRFERELLLVYPLGAMLSLGLNVSQTLPDREEDAAFGLKGLVHRLDQRSALWLAWGAFAGGIAGFALAAPVIGNNWKILGPGLALGTLLLVVMMTDYAFFRSLKRNWYGGAVLSIVVGLAWVASLPFA